MVNKNLILSKSESYELLDSGNGRKLERFGNYTLIRRESQALWNERNPKLWVKTDAEYIRTNEKYGDWKIYNPKLPKEWTYTYGSLHLKLALTPFGHVGVFPELAPQWDWISEKCDLKHTAKVLSLFSYTGAATLAAARGGAHVTHVDASKPAISWAIENQKLSGLTEKPIRWIVDDALKFVKREERRGNKYDGIIMDPPKFGRGPKGEVWQFEKDLPELLEYTAKIVTSTPLFFIITAYTVPVSSITIANMIQDLSLKNGMIEHGELVIEENSGRQLTTAIYSRWGVSL
jgi:23S rRNA (cytosine1962-C5)-methyltransferase